jgi:phytanoyl-CoA hydroxylase
MATLDAGKQLISDVWVDQPDAHDRVEERLTQGRINEVEAGRLHHFIEEGYLTTTLGLDDAFAAEFERDLDRIWRERPEDLAVAAKASDLVSFRDIDDEDRAVGYRIADLHSYSPSARKLYLHPQLFRLVELILDDRAVAFQSLYFQFGSEQGLHRDPMFVPTNPISHMVASWIALEDIDEGSGPLMYVPRSHRMPWFEFEPDSVKFVEKTEDKRRDWIAYRQQMLEEMGLEVKTFTCARGDAFLWHSGLLHGGSKVTREGATRRSIATHYSTAAHYKQRRGHMKTKVDGEWRNVSGATTRLLTENGCSGFDGPLRGAVPGASHVEATSADTGVDPVAENTTQAPRRLLDRLTHREK